MRRLLILPLLFLAASLSAQIQIERQLLMTAVPWHLQYFDVYDMVQLPDDSYAAYIGGEMIGINGTSNLFPFSGLLFLDEHGEIIIDPNTLLPKFHMFEFHLTNHNWVTGSSSTIPNAAWTKNSPEIARRSLIYTEDGKFVIYGIDANRDFNVLKLDEDGNIDFHKKLPGQEVAPCEDYDTKSIESVYDAIETSDGKLLFYGRSSLSQVSQTTSFCNYYLTLFRLDENGDFDDFYYEYHELPTKTDYFVEGSRVQEASDGSYQFGYASRNRMEGAEFGDRGIVDVDQSTGSINWKVTNIPFKDWVQVAEDTYVSVGFTTHVNPLALQFLSAKGEISKWQIISGNAYNLARVEIEDSKLMAMVQEDDGGFICVGTKNWGPLMVRFDASLQEVSNSAHDFSDNSAVLNNIRKHDETYFIGGFGAYTLFLRPSDDPNHTGHISTNARDPYIIAIPQQGAGWCSEGLELVTESSLRNLFYSEGGEKGFVELDLVEAETNDMFLSFDDNELCCFRPLNIEGDFFICAQNGSTTLNAEVPTIPLSDAPYWVKDGKVLPHSGDPYVLIADQPGDYYFFANTVDGCLYQGHFTVQYYSTPLWASPSYFGTPMCATDPAVSLYMINEPVPGTWSGTGVTGTFPNFQFDPAVAGVGTHSVAVHYLDDDGCEWNFDYEIEVLGPTSVTAPSIPTTFCLMDPVYYLPGPGNWEDYNGQSTLIAIDPSQYCSGCTLTVHYCETVSHPYTNCTACSGPITITFTGECKRAVDNGQDPLGTEAEEAEFSMYPNPTSGQVTLSWSSPFSGSLEVTDISGRVVASKNILSKSTLDLHLNELGRGNYLVRVMDTAGRVVHTDKLILVK